MLLHHGLLLERLTTKRSLATPSGSFLKTCSAMIVAPKSGTVRLATESDANLGANSAKLFLGGP